MSLAAEQALHVSTYSHFKSATVATCYSNSIRNCVLNMRKAVLTESIIP